MHQSPFGALLRTSRLAAGLTQEALAERARVSARTIADLERGVNQLPRHDTLARLLAALPLPPQQLALLRAAALPVQMPFAEVETAISPLPVPPAPLIGRRGELTEACRRLCDGTTRLLTLTGPAGVGKTRLALEIAQEVHDHFTDGIVFVDLTRLTQAERLPEALRFPPTSEKSPVEQVTDYLAARHILLVCDNCEHVIAGAAFIAQMIALCPRLVVLATSRVLLHVRAEHRLPIAPLPLAEAAMLFEERAHAVLPDGTFDPTLVERICRRLDCLPLAIELAATRVTFFSLSELAAHLENGLAALRGGASDLPEHQQTMHDAIEWSYALLSPEQQRCFRALGVFPDGWTWQAAEAVCGETSEHEQVVAAIVALADASLVSLAFPTANQARFSMLSLLREFALEQLRRHDEEDQYRQRHAAYYAHQVETVERQGEKLPLPDWDPLLDGSNVRAALQWALTHGDVRLGLRLTALLRGWWANRQMLQEAEQWEARLLDLVRHDEHPEIPDDERAQTLYEAGNILLARGRDAQAEVLAREALEQSERIGDLCGVSATCAILGQCAQRRGDLALAGEYFTASDDAALRSGYHDLRGFTLRNLAELARLRGDLTLATQLYQQALAVVRERGMRWGVALISALLGRLACAQGDYNVAKQRFRESMTAFQEFESPTYVAWCLEGYAQVLSDEGRHADTVRLCAAAATLRADADSPLPGVEEILFDQLLATAQATLTPECYQATWTEGAAMTLAEAVAAALSDGTD